MGSPQPNRVCAEYEALVDSLSVHPTTTKDLMELIRYANDVKDRIGAELLHRLQECHARVLFLIEHGSITVDDVRLNVFTFAWRDRLDQALEQCFQNIEATKKELQSTIMVGDGDGDGDDHGDDHDGDDDGDDHDDDHDGDDDGDDDGDSEGDDCDDDGDDDDDDDDDDQNHHHHYHHRHHHH